MSRRNRGNVEHSSEPKKASDIMQNLPDGVKDAMNQVRELNQEEQPEPKQTPVASELKDLVLFGKVTEDFVIGGYSIKISTLSNREQKALVKKIVILDKDERIMNIKTFTLSMAIKSINGVPLHELYQPIGDEQLSQDEMRIEVISDLQSNMVEMLFNKYEELVAKSNSFFKEGDLQDHVKN